jgi:hypothetical protein
MVEPRAKPPIVHRIRSWPRRVVITIAIVALVLVAARVALPFVVKNQINHRLAAIPGYSGHVEDVGIALWRGAYKLDGLAVFKVNGAVQEPFASARHIDFSVAWRELLHRKIVSDILIDGPELNFVAAGEASQKDVDRRWHEVLKDIFPLDITHLELTNGTIRYQDLTKAPHVDLFVKNMHVIATGLRNRPDETGAEFPAEITVDGESLGGGRLKIKVSANPLAPQPHFHLSANVDGVNLADLNESLRAYANVDVSRGTFRMAAEMAGKDGGFQGYVKPFFEDLNFNNIEDKNKKVLTRIWENVVGGLAWLVKNKARDQVGTRIPFQGRFGDPQVGLGTTIANLFRHGFIRAFNPTVEGSVHANNVLPTGDSANGKKVADTKTDPGPKTAGTKADKKASTTVTDETKAGAPTGRESRGKE